MSWIPDAVEAALVAGGVSLAGLLISNQSKVSEFRQQWIDALRNDVALLITHAHEIRAADTVDEVASSFPIVNEVTSRIELRLNPKEKESQAVLVAMAELRTAIHSTDDFTPVDLRVRELTRATQVVLKKEWRRVKTGEFAYRWVFRSVFASVLLLGSVWLYRNYPALLHFIVGK